MNAAISFSSLFSGIGGFDLAFQRAGMNPTMMVEIDRNCQEILRRHFPGIPLYDDIKQIGVKTHGDQTVRVICGGFPCQDVSIAGQRKGLAGERTGLWYEFARVIDEFEPEYVVAENVPGLLSSEGGEDFAVIVRWLAERGYGVCWRVLDAQYFGVAQRRRRVFIVASLGSGRSAEVLFESEGLSGNTPQGRKAGESVACSIRANPSHGGDKGDGGVNTTLVARPLAFGRTNNHNDESQQTYVASTLRGRSWKNSHMPGRGGEDDTNIIVEQNNKVSTPDMISLRADPAMPAILCENEPVAKTLNSRSSRLDGESQSFIWDMQQETSAAHKTKLQDEKSYTLNGAGQMMFGVRRLTPTECERLQGFPDGWTDGQADSVRYRQLGNAVAVPVVEWIAHRLVKVIQEEDNHGN